MEIRLVWLWRSLMQFCGRGAWVSMVSMGGHMWKRLQGPGLLFIIAWFCGWALTSELASMDINGTIWTPWNSCKNFLALISCNAITTHYITVDQFFKNCEGLRQAPKHRACGVHWGQTWECHPASCSHKAGFRRNGRHFPASISHHQQYGQPLSHWASS